MGGGLRYKGIGTCATSCLVESSLPFRHHCQCVGCPPAVLPGAVSSNCLMEVTAIDSGHGCIGPRTPP